MVATTEAARLSESQYALRRKELLSLVKQLRAIGAQADLDLPRITVIGNQSAGKSSVVEAISDINVPRDAGTCTRCPMECRMSSSTGPWSCQISIRWEFEDNGTRKSEVSEIGFGDVITDKGKVELALRRAQAAVLHPSVSADKFLAMSEDSLKKGISGTKPLSFSRNAVCIDLEGPGLTDLSFIDLPGIIQNAEPDVVKMVEDLVVSHIKGNCIILVALPMTDDIENQKALRLARQEDPEGLRTIGVITKPDMLSQGSTKARQIWLDVIEGRKHQLLHGYYCTRQPDDADRAEGISSSQARDAETAFFRTTSPWSTSVHQNRFGTPNLVSTLSARLVSVINDTLPKIRSETNALLDVCKKDLSSLPAAVEGEPATHVLSLVTTFCSHMNQFVSGGNAHLGRLVQDNRRTFAKFKLAIRRTAPNFVPFAEATEAAAQFENFIGEGEDEGPEEGLISSGGPVYLKALRRHIELSITRELPDNVPFAAKVSLISEFQSSWQSEVDACMKDVRDAVLSILSDCTQEHFQRYGSLKGQLRMFIAELVQRHHDICRMHITAILQCEQTPFTQNTHYLETCKDKWLAKYKDIRSGKTDAITEPPAKRRKQDTAPAPSAPKPTPAPGALKFDGFMFGAPQSPSSGNFAFAPGAAAGSISGGPQLNPRSSEPPANTAPAGGATNGTVQPSSLGSSTPAAPQSALRPANDAEKVNAALAALAELGYTGLTHEDLGKLNPPDKYEQELHVMAEVRGYFQVSYKRIIDNVPSLIDLTFVKAIVRDLQPFLISKLGLGTADASARCARYLAEDPNVVARRDDLLARQRRLESVDSELHNFGL